MAERAADRPEVDVVWYGERGVVNALVDHLADAGIAGVQSLLKKATVWAGENPPKWIDCIRSVEYIVEIGLGEFGDPDLMIVCHSDEWPPQLVFVEAKVISYGVSAIRNTDGMSARGFNSSINGQLALKYRFANALNAWDAGNEIVEPKPLHEVYSQDIGGLADYKQQPRRLRKASVLQILKDCHLAGLPAENVCFVAMTWDSKAFFDDADPCDPVILPLFLSETGDDCWDVIKHRVGWIGYQAFGDESPMELAPDHPFQKALRTMVDAATPLEETSQDGFSSVLTYNRSQASGSVLATLKQIEADARQVFGNNAVKEYAGSTSIAISGKVLIKLMAHTGQNGGKPGGQNERVWLGVSASISTSNWTNDFFDERWLIGSSQAGQPFRMKRLEPATALSTAHDVFRQVWDLLGRPETDNDHN